MQNQLYLRRSARVCLGLFFFVILAGSVVRTTGSGMGCPDWPTCFGHYIPPTSQDALLFQMGKHYPKGQMIIHGDTLWVANESFQSGRLFDHRDWHKYPKHDYAKFDATETWIEYLNRLATGLFIIPVLVMSGLSFRRMRTTGDKSSFMLTLGCVLTIGFEAWVGKLVVDGNLKTGSVTLHMVGSLLIVLCILGVLWRIRSEDIPVAGRSALRASVIWLLVISLLQIVLGSQVREETDRIALSGAPREAWISLMGNVFYIHRSFSILVTGLIIWVWLLLRKSGWFYWARILLITTVIEIAAGMVLAYLEMPAWIQPVHLLFAIIMFSIAFYLVLLSMGSRQLTQTSVVTQS
jgi:heme a synthase